MTKIVTFKNTKKKAGLARHETKCIIRFIRIFYYKDPGQTSGNTPESG